MSTTSDHCDVLIVGGGPAGSSVAAGLAGTGLDALIIDRAEFPRDKICAGWVTPQILSALAIDSEEYAATGNVMQPIEGFRVGRAGQRTTDVDFGEVVSYGIRRREFDHFLLKRSGARTRLGFKIERIERRDDQWRINDGEIVADALVGAGGHFCPVARHLGATPGKGEPTVLATEIEFEMTDAQVERCRARAELPELYFTPDLKGYGWVVRKGERWLNVGVGRQDPHAFPHRVKEFVTWLEDNELVPPGLPRMHGHAYLLHAQAPRPLSADGVFLVGDAAGLAYLPSGEGIRPAVESGLFAARTLAAHEGQIHEWSRREYERSVVTRLGRRHGKIRPGVTAWIPERWRPDVAGRILSNPWFARHVVVGKWFLHRDQPALDPIPRPRRTPVQLELGAA